MILEYDESDLRLTLEALSPLARTIFAASVGERLVPAYAPYALAEGNDPTALTSFADRLWDDISGRTRLPARELWELGDACASLTPPDEVGRWIPERVYAEHGAAAVGYAFRCQAMGAHQDAMWAATRAYEAVDQFVDERELVGRTKSGDRILLHPIVQTELRRQRRDLAELKEMQDSDLLAALPALRARARAEFALRLEPG